MPKCATCGFEADNFPESTCPQCGKNIAPRVVNLSWIAVLVQLAFGVGFMAAFHFPRPMIGFFAVTILLSAAFSSRLRRMAAARPRVRLAPAPQSLTVRLLNAAIALCGFAGLLCLMFGFVVFMNSWSAWQRLQGQSYHATTFQVTRAYYEAPRGRQGARVFASGLVEGRKEWMDLFPYLKAAPHDQLELNALVPQGTAIPVYLFPDLKGYSRMQVIGPLPPAEANYKRAMWVLNRGLTALAVLAGVVFVLTQVRRSCQQTEASAAHETNNGTF